MRDLSPDERDIWERVTQAVRRLHAEPAAPEPAPAEPSLNFQCPKLPTASPKRRGRVPPARHPAPRAPARKPGTLDGSWDRRLTTGKAQIDRVVDLHGHDLERAWGLVDRELDQALASEERVMLLITGKPPRDVPPHARGRIRAAIGDWLHASRHAPRIAAVRPAAQRHGGTGALYVVLRRNKG